MSSTKLDTDLRAAILARPDAVLGDSDVMQALIDATGPAKTGKVIDLRGVAMERLEGRLDRLEDTHRSVIAAAYENLAGTNQIHRAILRMLDPVDLASFIDNLATDVTATLRVDALRLIIEAPAGQAPADLKPGGILRLAKPGTVTAYLEAARAPTGPVVLRPIGPTAPIIWDDEAAGLGSEACLCLDLGTDGPVAMLIMGAADPAHFSPQQGTDLLTFFAGVVERTLRRWLA